MPQTMMAFLAMMIAALAAINQYTAQVSSYEQAYRNEFELMANAVVLEEMEIVDLTTDYDDLDALSGTESTREYTVGSNSVEFTLTYTVGWVEEDGTPSEVETDQKEVTISATHEKFAVTLVAHSRMFAD